jgi:hypothetical protein
MAALAFELSVYLWEKMRSVSAIMNVVGWVRTPPYKRDLWAPDDQFQHPTMDPTLTRRRCYLPLQPGN